MAAGTVAVPVASPLPASCVQLFKIFQDFFGVSDQERRRNAGELESQTAIVAAIAAAIMTGGITCLWGSAHNWRKGKNRSPSLS